MARNKTSKKYKSKNSPAFYKEFTRQGETLQEGVDKHFQFKGKLE